MLIKVTPKSQRASAQTIFGRSVEHGPPTLTCYTKTAKCTQRCVSPIWVEAEKKTTMEGEKLWDFRLHQTARSVATRDDEKSTKTDRRRYRRKARRNEDPTLAM